MYRFVLLLHLCLLLLEGRCGAQTGDIALGQVKRNNLVARLLEVKSIAAPGQSFTFARPRPGWVFIAVTCAGQGMVKISIDGNGPDSIVVHDAGNTKPAEAMRWLVSGDHKLQVACDNSVRIERLVVNAIPELIHCGLGFDPAIKSYGHYDMAFLAKDVLPNVTTLIVPHNIQLDPTVIHDWRRQGKRFVAEVGIDSKAKTPAEHVKHWTGFLDKAPFLDGFIINEFIVNTPFAGTGSTLSPERKQRLERARQQHRDFEAAFRMMRSDGRYKDKMLYAYVGGSGKKLNQEVIGPTFIRTLLDCGYQVALERYLHEMSSEQKSKDALQIFVDGISDWEAKQSGAKKQMVVAFGLFSMPPGGINKQPNVDYHVWMDQQMNVVANHPALADLAGLEWWTSILADEETVRFVGKLYRHYAIEGCRELLTKDPLFLTHIHNADFENGTEGWTLQAAEPGSVRAGSFPRYGRIEGRFMGLGRPADPEHIGDTFLVMQRSPKGPNTFSQTIRNLQPGRLYSMKMFTCDHRDLVAKKKKSLEEAQKFIGTVTLEGVEVDRNRSFAEMYASNPEPPIPVWITYHWTVFRAKGPTAKVVVSDWTRDAPPTDKFGQEQTFNFLEIQPYHE